MRREHSPTDDLRDLRVALSEDSSLAAPERLVLAVLILHRNGETGRLDPSLTTICSEAGLGRSTVVRALASLEGSGWIERERARDGHSRTKYRVTLPASPSAALVPQRDQSRSGPRLVPERAGGSATAGPERTKERTKERTSTDALFEEAWSVHCRGPKSQAREQYRKAVPARVSHEQLLAALRTYVRTQVRADFQGVHLFRFIRDDRWEEYAHTNGTGPATHDRPEDRAL